ncbi:hypothetical protein MMC10_011264 [Thelotrema lepadinum]|nr:hypothetical protein [Thelotrema lepadinum]
MRGPIGMTIDIAFNWTDLLSLRVLHHYKIAHAVPLDGEVSYEEIAQKTGLREDLLFCYLRMGMSNHISDENPKTGHVRHTAASRLLVTSTGFADAVGLETEEFVSAGSKATRASDKWGQETNEPYQSSFALVNQAPIFEVLAKHPDRGLRFGSAMQFFTVDDAWDLRHAQCF